MYFSRKNFARGMDFGQKNFARGMFQRPKEGQKLEKCTKQEMPGGKSIGPPIPMIVTTYI
ncbi:MAG TPA: hypothetical protein DDY12_03855 [Porphyromonadaceae bacterium]|nr:hypothetical protein [Porphyromonadaceae bacterium]